VRQLPKLNVAGSSPVVRSKTQISLKRQGSSTGLVLGPFVFVNGHQSALFSFSHGKDFSLCLVSSGHHCRSSPEPATIFCSGGISVTLAGELAKLERLAKEKKEWLHPSDVTDLLTAIEYYIRSSFRRGKAVTTVRAEYYELMYFYEDHVLHNDFVTEGGIQPVPLSSITSDDILMHLHRLRTKTPDIRRNRKAISDATVERRFRILHAFFNWLIKAGVTGHNPCFGLEKPPVRKKIPAVWSLHDVQVFLASFDRSVCVKYYTPGAGATSVR
jgi:hypothetical protein